jgi:sigma-B regulation protein RsbU (phosphoserine phosphatase)
MAISFAFILSGFLPLFQAMCVIVLAAYMVTRSKYFVELISGDASWKNQLILSAFFGALSIYGTAAGISIAGAILNVRDLGPIVGGLTCGPIVGLGAGLIGAVFRYSEGGFTALPCSIAPVIAGILAGLIRMKMGKFPGITISVALAALMELTHELLVLTIARPYDQALEAVEGTIVPLILVNSLGVLFFTFIVSNFIKERSTLAERDKYRRELERKEAEMALATEIQESFLPHKVPSIQRFDLAASSLPALEVGGDFYDFIPGQDGKLGLAIADVAGKGVPAALFMALSKTIVRNNALRNRETDEVLNDSNQVISAESSAGMFVTLFLGLLDQETGKFSYSNAGHNPPLIFRAKGAEFESLDVTGVALGIMDEAVYSQSQTALEPGDLMVMYTDGIVEAMNPSGELFGMERLKKVISRSSNICAEEVRAKIVDEVIKFSSGAQQSDDITALVVKAR